MLYPKATADILDSCNIKYKNLHPSELSKVVKNNSDNLKMLNRIIKLTFLVNKDGTVDMKNHQRNKSFREVMQKGSGFLNQNRDVLKEATLIARSMMTEQKYSEILDKNVTQYLNLDGQAIQVEEKSKIPTLIVIGLLVFGIYAYYKQK